MTNDNKKLDDLLENFDHKELRKIYCLIKKGPIMTTVSKNHVISLINEYSTDQIKTGIAEYHKSEKKKKIWRNSTLITVSTVLFFYIIPIGDSSIGLYQKWHEIFSRNSSIDQTQNQFRFKSNKDSLTILIPRFDSGKTNSEDCVGKSIYIHLLKQQELNGLKIKIHYDYDIDPPYSRRDAKNLINFYNSDVIIYGLSNNLSSFCTSARSCFHNLISDTILSNISLPSGSLSQKHDYKKIEVNIADIEDIGISFWGKTLEKWLNSILLLKGNDQEKAIAQVELMTSVDTTDLTISEKADVYFNRGIAFKKFGLFNKAKADFDNALLIDENHQRAKMQGAFISYENHDFETALKTIEQFYDNGQIDHADIFGIMAHCYQQIGEIERSKEFYSMSLSKRETLWALKNFTLVYIDEFNYSAAENLINRILVLYPNNGLGYYLRGLLFRLSEDYSQAVKYYNQSIRLDYNLPHVYSHLGSIYCDHLNDLDLAIKLFNKSIALDPTNATYNFNMAVALNKNKNPRLALDFLNKVIKYHPGYLDAYILKIEILVEMGDFESAIVFAHSIYNKFENDIKMANTIASLFNSLGCLKNSISIYNKILEMDSTNQECLANRCLSFIYMELEQEAKEDITRLVELNSKWINYTVDRYNLAFNMPIFSVDNNLKKIEEDSTDYYNYTIIASYYEKKSEFGKALFYRKKALDMNFLMPNKIINRLSIANNYACQGKLEEAENFLNSFLAPDFKISQSSLNFYDCLDRITINQFLFDCDTFVSNN